MLHFTPQMGYSKEKKKGGGNMATRSANVNVRVEPDVKKQAEDILDKLGVYGKNGSGCVQSHYRRKRKSCIRHK